ncbi:MAG: type III-A CRISPR-associated protein Csm2 [Clostridiales Family XIII bacterium]|jgi:CRISPR-associated protein Csm2|nr:type III-A CRISPR-associated protein Csm2 [Clostridiales Family XIII bacterium]
MKTIHEENYVEKAESVMRALIQTGRDGKKNFAFTTTQIRKLLSISADIYDGAKNEQDDRISPKLKEKLNYLRVQIVYQAGRLPKNVKPFVEKAELLEVLKETGDERKNVLLFCRYMEALVAYHRYLGGEN